MAITRTVTVAAGRFAPGHLGELTAVVPFELVDAVLAETRSVQRRLRDLPSRVGIYFLLAMCLFPEVGRRLAWDKLTAGLADVPVASPTPEACVICADDWAALRCGRCTRFSRGLWPGRRHPVCGLGPTGLCRSTAAVPRRSPTPSETGPDWDGALQSRTRAGNASRRSRTSKPRSSHTSS
ncbi:transposase domain-containing protein [Streptomyces sp. NBC_00233]|uniref:transposase domain-containing protein n=1 Tax=Streptomyces sp. NBC_00233 TaxID=2975686 RepID=UPI0022586971|nr:transposase domain-containing protein [Streptomyces sp. NBC_00233]MCX5231499.1 transposase domain-containing protein [Streptomyces sp. NBC_00233]MCX5233173.1 transposase domain-containing protein [Streptomyces sp. NBC_00233]MCX5233614.1 transposase domain-containing protein [Streptomyces sp. NBC_00233]